MPRQPVSNVPVNPTIISSWEARKIHGFFGVGETGVPLLNMNLHKVKRHNISLLKSHGKHLLKVFWHCATTPKYSHLNTWTIFTFILNSSFLKIQRF